MGLFSKNKKKKPDYTFKGKPFLMNFKPKQGYVFHSDYFQVDDGYATILSYFHRQGASDSFPAFWGINKIPVGMPEGVSVTLFEQVSRKGESWIASHQTKAETVVKNSSKSQVESGTASGKHKASKAEQDLIDIAMELNNGASYLNAHFRVLIKAPDLDSLDTAVSQLERLYTERFDSMWVGAYSGEQRQELSNITGFNDRKRGKGFYFTSTEYAGAYSLVTHGIEDAGGEYVGYMVGDVNNSAVLFNINRYKHHVVVATDQINTSRNRAKVSDMWGSKLSQSALVENGRVIHIILNGANLDNLGPKFSNITYKIDMNKGDINMFEMFGKTEDELSIYSSHIEKIILMAEQAYETNDSERSIIRNTLSSVLEKYYIDKRMWYPDAKNNRDKLRIVGIPHEEVPKLSTFVSYLETEYKAMVNRSAKDQKQLNALNILRGTFKSMLDNNGDLFNTTTNSVIDNAVNGRRVIYDFSGLSQRGHGLAMAQLVNVIGYATSSLGINDLLVIHGTENIKEGVKDYLTTKFDALYERGCRIAFLFNKVETALDNAAFVDFDKSDYIILGNMSSNTSKRYQSTLGRSIPNDLDKLITSTSESVAYIRRGFDNVVFKQDLRVDIDDSYRKDGDVN